MTTLKEGEAYVVGEPKPVGSITPQQDVPIPPQPNERGWTFEIITADSPQEELDQYFAKMPATYRERGAIGDVVEATTLFGTVRGTVIDLSETKRTIDTGGSLFFQQWVGGHYWLNISGISKRAMSAFVRA